MKPELLPLFVVNLLLLLSACGSTPIRDEDWPTNMPSRAHYQLLYEQDKINQSVQSQDEYLYWVVKFYEGYNALRGWHQISLDVLQDVPAENYVMTAARLDYLGQMISGEWAKLSPERVIINRTVSAWRDAAYEAARRNELLQLITRMINDVEALFSGTLTHEAIRPERYYDNLGADDWNDFEL